MDKKLLLCEFLFLLFISASAQHPVIGGYNVYYGCLHNHSNVSDGSGTPATAYNYAKNISHLDFFGLSDHSYSISSDEWEDIQSQADDYNEDGVFTSFYGFEWSADGTYGHITVVNTADYCSTDSPTNSLNGLSSWLSARSGGVAFFNHPGRDTYNTIEFGYFASSPSDQFVGLELWNSGNGFSTYYYNDGYYSGDNNKSFIDEANERGWKLGASGSEDNHAGTWGAYNQYRLAVLSNALTRPALLDAIRERRFYSTLDKNIALSFKINGMEMGSSLAGGNYTARIQAVDSDGETFNQVILFNRYHDIVNQWSLNSGSVNVTANLTTFDGDYYYVKVRQADGDEAISSPIWISGGSSNQHPVCSITTPSNGSTFSAPALITIGANASDSDGSVTKVEFYQGSTKIGEDISAPYSISWSGVSAGNYSLTVRATDNAGSTATSLPVSVTVNARSITVRADSQTKVYGRSDPELTYEVVSGSLMGSDTFRGVLSREPGENVGEYSINQGTLNLNDNYIITFLESSFTITERPVTVTAESKVKNFGDTDPGLTIIITSGRLIGTDTFHGSLVRESGENVGIYSIRQGSLSLSDNYIMTFESSELTILPRPVTITANPRTKVYGDPDNLTYRITSGTLAGSDAFTGFLSRVNGENVGSYSIMQGTLAVNSNYAVTFIGANLTIVPRNISVTADSRTKKYGETDPEFTYRITSGSLVSKGDAVSGVLSREAGEDVGVYAIRQGTLFISNNYRISFVGASLTIESAFLTIVADIQSKSFGDPDPELTFKVTSGSLVGTDTITGRLLRDDGEDVGEYSINQGSLQLNTNYTLVFSGATFKITPRPVTVMAVARKKVFGESDPELTYRITSGNLVGSDSFTGGLIRDAGEDVGTYVISQGDLALGSNYDLTFIGANFRITAEFEMKAYPNPFSDHIVFELEFNNSANISIVLYSFNGIKLATVFSGNVEPGFYTFEYRPHNVIKGFLIYQLFIDGKEIVDGKAIHQ